MRSVHIRVGGAKFAEGSALIEVGDTQVVCTASVDEKVPKYREAAQLGWVTAEYAMLPRATQERTTREVKNGHVGGRTAEIQRLIGRSLRAIVDFKALGPRTITIDCDVLQADGGTRTAAITGGYVALAQACDLLMRRGKIATWPLLDQVAAVSVGMVDGRAQLDLDYADDVRAEVDMNIVLTGRGRFVEVQGTAEHHPFDERQLQQLLRLARGGIKGLLLKQRTALRGVLGATAPRGR